MKDYKKSYNEILAWARKNKARLNGVPIEEVLHELAESEDERIRKAIIGIIKNSNAIDINVSHERMIAYLEKQKVNTEGDFGRGYDCGYQAGYAVAMNEKKPKAATATLDSEKQKEQKPELTEFEKRVRFIIDEVSAGRYSADNIDDVRGIAEGLLKLAGKEYVQGMPMPEDTVIFQKGVEEGRRLEREEMKDELAKKHLDGYCMGREDTLRETKDFVESHFTHREYKSPECGTCASALNTSSGTSTLKAEG